MSKTSPTATTTDTTPGEHRPPWPVPLLGALAVVLLVLVASCVDNGDGGGNGAEAHEAGAIGVDPATLSPVVDHRFVAFAQVKRAVYEGVEIDEGEQVQRLCRLDSQPAVA